MSPADRSDRSRAPTVPRRDPVEGPIEPRDRTPASVLEALRYGNARYLAGRPHHPHQGAADREALLAAQTPIAAVVACSDARVPPSLVLDQGLGDLFVIRVAGHVLGENVVASVHYAVQHLGVPVVLVLGHEGCGAVGLAVDAVAAGGDENVPLVRAIAPSARTALIACGAEGTEAHDEAVRLHALATAERLRADPTLAARIADGGLWVGPAVYRMNSGRIDGLDEDASL
jgi:carbonic anhydrase